ncbi:MAG: ACP S-malonyltransferase [Clostridia bacterium]|nr:ACP S-malonyltransferase [Clostridia bacterium]
MSKIAFVFAGQGAQYPGMGQNLCENFRSVKELYDAADAHRPGTSGQSFSGTEAELKQTINTQPCVFLADLAAALALEESGIHADLCAGFSLGELAALACSGVFTHTDAFAAVCERAKCMEKASKEMDGEPAMAAVMKITAEEVEELCRGIDGIYPVNYNSPGQTAVSGTKAGLEAFCEKAKGVRVMPIPVSGAFHSPYMAQASAEFENTLKKITINKPSVPVYANLTGEPYPEDVVSCLAAQMKSPVRWQTTIERMIADGADIFIECGPGKTLAGLIRRIDKNVKVYSVQDTDSLNAVLAEFEGE